MDDKQLQSLQEQLAKDKQNRLASGFDPYAKPLFAQFGGLTGSISENIEPMSFEKTWDEQAQFDKEYLGLRTLKAFDDLKFDVVDDTGSSFNRGRSAVQYGTQMSSMGWGERNPLAERYRMNIAKAKADDFILPSGEIGTLDDTLKGASNWFGGLKEGFEKWFRETETEKGYKALRERLEEVDPTWDAVKKYESLDNWRKNNSEAFDFIERAGINISNYVEPSRNEAGFNVAVYEAAKDAIVAHRMRLWNDSSRYIAKTYAEVVEGFKDPLLARDIITTTVLTAGLAAPQLIGARVGGTAMQAAARTSAGLLNYTGPMTGFVEGLVYPALQASVLRGAGRSGLQTFTARALSMFAEGTTQGVLSALESQRDEYEWRNLLFHDADKLEKYDFGDTLKIGLTTGAASAAFLGAMRFGLGALGEWKYYRKGDWKNLGRSWANSLDNWAQTKEGLTVFGETLSDGRGILLGNKLDKYMARHDGRNFTNVMLNGSRLFGKMDPTIAAKINLDTKEAIKVIDAFEEATGIAGEAAMRGVDGVDAETKGLFLASLDQDYLKKLGLNYDDVTTVFKEFKNAKDKNLIGPLERSAVSRGLENVASVRKLNDTRTMFRMVEVKAIDKNLAEAGIKSADVLELAEDALEKSVNLLDAQDWSNFRLAAVFAADAALEDNLASRLSSIFSNDETILVDGKPIPREVVAPLFKQALKIEEGRKDFIYLTNGGEDNKATFVLMIDPETGEVLKTKRKLVRDDKGNLNVEFEASKNPSYKPENIRSVKEFNEGLHSAIEKANEFFKEEKKSKTRKKIDGVKDPEKKEALEKTFEEMFNEGLDPTIDNIRKIFGKDKMSVSQATVANIIMRSLGYDPEDRLIKIANGSVAETASGNIVLLGTNAIINATKASDLGTLTHEMSHYVRHIFGNETDFAKEARTALGIDESLWSKFKDWCGVEGDNWTVAAEEKFARGFAFYIKSIMEGNGKAPVTSVQRLFHILGDHIGDIGQKFKSEGELGFEMTPVAEEVFEKLFLRSNDNISELFDVAYHKIFRNLPKERREEIGAAVLGEMAWNDYKAKTQKSIAERRMKTDPVIAGSSIPRESTAAVVDRISASVSGSASKKLIKAAIKAGLPMDKVVEYINNQLTLFAERAYTQIALSSRDKVLKTSKIDEVPTGVIEKLVFDEKNTAYVATDIEFVFADGTIKPVVSVTSITKNQADRELRNRRLRGTKPPISVPDKVAEMTDAVSEVTTKTGFVDKDGVSVDLSPTEAVVATVKNIEAKETEVAAARTELIADKLETMTLDKVDDVAATTEEAKDAQLKEIKKKNPELAKELDSEDVNVEFTARPTQVSVTVTRLKRVSDSSSRVVQEIASDKDKEQLTIVAETLIASPSRYDELVSIWENYGKNIALPRPLREYLLAEVKKIIARDTLDRMIGLSDLELERFVDIKEKIDLIDSELGSKELEAFTREPNAETTKALSLVSGISEEDLQLYSRGNFHLVNQLHVVEFRIASEFVKTHKDSYDNKVEFLKNNKAAYENANIKETKTPEEQELIEKYNGIKATVSRYDNSVKRVSMGLLGEEVVSVGSLKAIETGMIFDISKGDTYKRIIEIFVGKDYEIGIDDLIAEFSKSPSTVESIGKKLGLSPEESLGGFKAWAAGENEYNGTPFTADALTVTRKYVRGILRTLSDKTKTGERTHKGVIGLYVKSSSGDESAVDVAINRRKSKTNEHIEINNESQIMQFTASVFYDELVRSGETKLAEYFAARRATYWLPGDRLENLVDSYNKRGVDGSELTKSKIDTLEKNLKKKIDEFATRLRLSGLNDAATTVTDAQFNLSMVKPVVLNQSSTEAAIKSLGELIEKSYVSFDRPVKVDRSIIREIEINKIRRGFSEDLRKLNDKIIDGRVRDAKGLIEEVAAYKNTYTDIAKKLLENKNTRELLENVTVMPSIYWSRGAFHPRLNMITLNPFDLLDEQVIIHETIHATTYQWLSEDFWNYAQKSFKEDIGWLSGTEYINGLREIVEQGGDKITPTTKALITLYLKAFDSMGLPDSLKELVNNRNAYLVDTAMTRTLYGFFNIDEFLTESISNPAFIDILMQIEGNKTNLISQLLEPVFVSTGLEKTPETVKLASGSILNNILEHTLAISQSSWIREFSKSNKDILSLMEGDTRKQEFRIDLTKAYLSSFASFRHMGIDPKSKPLIFNQSLIDPAVKEELKLRRDLKASKGRLFEQYRILGQEKQQQIFEAAETKEFKDYFLNSKATQDLSVTIPEEKRVSGKPLILFHGTGNADFQEFRYDYKEPYQHLLYGNGVYLTDSPRIAGMYAKPKNLDETNTAVFIQKGGWNFLDTTNLIPFYIDEFVAYCRKLDGFNDDYIDKMYAEIIKLNVEDELIDDSRKAIAFVRRLNKVELPDSTLLALQYWGLEPKTTEGGGPGVFPVFVSLQKPIDADNDRFTFVQLKKILDNARESKEITNEEYKDLNVLLYQFWRTGFLIELLDNALVGGEKLEPNERLVVNSYSLEGTVKKIKQEDTLDFVMDPRPTLRSVTENERDILFRSLDEDTKNLVEDSPISYDEFNDEYWVFLRHKVNNRLVGTYVKLDAVKKAPSYKPLEYMSYKNVEDLKLTFSDFVDSTGKIVPGVYGNFFDYIKDNMYEHVLIRAFMANGYDGVTHIGGNRAGGNQLIHRVFISWKPGQIKSVFNFGTWDPSKPNILYQKRAEKALSDRIEKAKALGEDTKKLEKELSELVDSAAVRRRNLLEKGFSEEMEPEDIDIIKSMIEGKMPLSGTTGDLMMSRYGSPSTAVSVAAAAAKFKGKAYRDLDKKERMEFVLDVLMPKISEVMGKRNTSAGVFSAASDSVVGKKVNSLIGGGAAYGDTADSSSMGLQFLSKILDPTMDLRDGEIGGVFELFSVDKLNAELNNSYSRSGLLAVKNKMLSRLSSEEDIRSVVHTAWNLLAEPEDSLKTKLESVNNKDLVLDLIKATNKFNEYRADLMMKYGNLKMVDPSKYGTRHRVNNLAFSDQQGFVKALTDNAINKTLDNGELSVITAEALGWLKIRRETGATDSIVSIEVVKDSPIKLKPGFYDWNNETRKLFGKTETDKDGNKITAISRLLDSSDIDKHNKALYSNEDYIPAFKRLYESRGTEYTAIRQSMAIAKDRYLGIVDGDTKTGKPRSESIGRGMDYNEERILSHAEITANPELSKYFRKNIFDLIHDDLRGQLTDLLMKKYISDFFGVKMSWSDLVEILKDYGEESQDKANMSMSEIESRRRGYDRMHDIWEQNIGYSIRTKDSLDRHYNRLITDSRIPVLLFGGIRAAASSLPEIGRAIIASNHNKNKLVQVVPNFIKMLTLFSKNKRDTIKEVASATHWLRGLSSDHLLARSEVSPENPFGGTMLGSRKGGFFKRFAEDWREVSDLNKTESSIVGKTLNRASLFATRLGTPLAWVNDVTTTLHVWNAQTNLTKNSSKFLQLADKLSKKKPTNLGDFAVLAKECGLTAKEAVDLSSAGLLNPSKIKVMIEAAKDQKNYTDGLLDVQKLFIWAGDDQVKIDAINAMGAYINTTSRQTNTEPTLLDLRINQSAFAKSMAVFMQFLLSHSVQEIGRRRRYSTADYGKHLAGLVIMEAVTYSLARQKPDEDKWIWEEARENPIDTIIRISTGMPMLGSYQMWGPVLRMILKGGTNLLTGEDENERLRLPDLYQAPAENLPNKGLEILKSAFEVAF